jgi:hypothetical protein
VTTRLIHFFLIEPQIGGPESTQRPVKRDSSRPTTSNSSRAMLPRWKKRNSFPLLLLRRPCPLGLKRLLLTRERRLWLSMSECSLDVRVCVEGSCNDTDVLVRSYEATEGNEISFGEGDRIVSIEEVGLDVMNMADQVSC